MRTQLKAQLCSCHLGGEPSSTSCAINISTTTCMPIHCLTTEGVFNAQGEFLPLPIPATYILKDIEDYFRRSLLERLHRAEHLSEHFMSKLLDWNPSGFSLFRLRRPTRL